MRSGYQAFDLLKKKQGYEKKEHDIGVNNICNLQRIPIKLYTPFEQPMHGTETKFQINTYKIMAIRSNLWNTPVVRNWHVGLQVRVSK